MCNNGIVHQTTILYIEINMSHYAYLIYFHKLSLCFYYNLQATSTNNHGATRGYGHTPNTFIFTTLSLTYLIFLQIQPPRAWARANY